MTSSQQQSSSAVVLAAAVAGAALAATLVSWAAASANFRARQEATTELWRRRRDEERTGRIRAEVKLRTALKGGGENTQLQAIGNGSKAKNIDNNRTRMLEIIGTVVSPYQKRMGTPRQPQLVPSSRGYVEFFRQAVAPASLDGIQAYSHVWIIFEFHANTSIGSKRTKVRPPRGNGQKVGQLATRSPHRPNPIGLSLVKVERWDETKLVLHISGLDLVNGTPVYDVKPCVPWDVPGHPFKSPNEVLKVPDWVEQDDAFSSVDFSGAARKQLREFVAEGRLAPLYAEDEDGFEAAAQTLREVLAQDPRSSHKGVDSRGKTSPDDNYSLIFAQCEVHFSVSASGVLVNWVSAADFHPDSYVEGIPLISEASVKKQMKG